MSLFLLPFLGILQSTPVAPDLRHILEAAIRVDVTDGRFVTVEIDTVASAAPGATLINRYPRIFAYLVQHQLPPERLFVGVVVDSTNRRGALIRNLLADFGAVQSLVAFLGSVERPPQYRPVIAEADLLAIAARFFHPVVTKENTFGFFRCAGVNGIQDLGQRRNPLAEAFAFWALGPVIFDADTA